MSESRPRQHIPVAIFVRPRVDSLMIVRPSAYPREDIHCKIGLFRRHFVLMMIGTVYQ